MGQKRFSTYHPLALKGRHLSVSAFFLDVGVPEGLVSPRYMELVVADEPFELSCVAS